MLAPRPSHALLAAVVLLAGCRIGRQHARDYVQAPRLTPDFSPDRDRVAAHNVAGHLVARQVLGAKDSTSIAHRIDGICLEQIRWDSTFSFGTWEPARWMDLPSYQDVIFPTGPKLRIKFSEPVWYAFPIHGDDRDLPWECKTCLDSLRRATIVSGCR